MMLAHAAMDNADNANSWIEWTKIHVLVAYRVCYWFTSIPDSSFEKVRRRKYFDLLNGAAEKTFTAQRCLTRLKKTLNTGAIGVNGLDSACSVAFLGR
jgi:hypothetical protein